MGPPMTRRPSEGAKNGLSVETRRRGRFARMRRQVRSSCARTRTHASISTHAITDVGRHGVFYVRPLPSLRSKRRSLYA